MDEIPLHGGVANAGSVTRMGPHVLRPSNPFTPSIHRFLSDLATTGFDGASVPVGVDIDGRERLVFIEGDVALPPYPRWAQSDRSLTSLGALMRRFHDAAATVPVAGTAWSSEMTDPEGGPIVCHNDVCLENIVFRDEVAVGLLDFDFAAPGRPVYDLAQCARMCVPVDDPESAALIGWIPADTAARLRLMADAYGLDGAGRRLLFDILDDGVAIAGRFVQRRVEAGDANFTLMWNWMGGMERYDRRRRWWADERPRHAAALS